jgi:hypothetical protein
MLALAVQLGLSAGGESLVGLVETCQRSLI